MTAQGGGCYKRAYLLGVGITGGCSDPGMWMDEAEGRRWSPKFGSETICLRPEQVTKECTCKLARWLQHETVCVPIRALADDCYMLGTRTLQAS
jgi:hypothetical protein